jgi:hypothetical protein
VPGSFGIGKHSHLSAYTFFRQGVEEMFPTRSMKVIGDLRESQGNVMLHIGKRRALGARGNVVRMGQGDDCLPRLRNRKNSTLRAIEGGKGCNSHVAAKKPRGGEGSEAYTSSLFVRLSRKSSSSTAGRHGAMNHRKAVSKRRRLIHLPSLLGYLEDLAKEQGGKLDETRG